MFKAISNLWKTARGTELFKQIDDICSIQVPSFRGDAATKYVKTVASEIDTLRNLKWTPELGPGIGGVKV
jgi:hypothetical protein